MPRQLRHLVCAVTGALALALPASAAAALPAQLVAPGCPGAADCTAPTDRTPVRTGWTRTTTISLTGNDPGSGIDRMEWILDGGSLQSGVYGVVVDLGGDGTHTLATRAVDNAGNSSAWLEQTIQLDTTAPSDATAAPSSVWSPTPPVTLTFLGSDVAGGSGLDRMEYRIGSTGTVNPVTSGTPVPFVTEGATVVQHRAVDVAGNVSAWRSDTVRIDTTAPVDDSAAPTGWSANGATVTLAGTDPFSGVDLVRWRVPGGPTQTAASGTALPITTAGVSTIETQVLDRAGNASAWQPITVRVDTADPVDTTGIPLGWQTTSPVTVTVGGTDAQAGVTAVEWMVDSPTVQRRTTSSATFTVATDGVHDIQTRVTDGAGRQTEWRRATLKIDTTAPTNNTTVPAGWVSGPVDVTLDGADGGSGVARIEWALDGGTVTNGVRGTVIPVRGEGVHTLSTTVVDAAGLRTAVPSTIRIDATAPAFTSSVPGATRYGALGRIPLTATDATSGVARVEWRVDGGSVQTGVSGALVDLGAAGSHTLARRVVDRAGNATEWETTTVLVDPALNGDTDDPTDTTSAPAGWSTDPTVDVPVTGTDPTTAIGLVQWRLDGGSIQSGAPGTLVRFSGDGVHRFETRVRDLLGHTTAWVGRTVRIDATVPTDTTDDPVGWTRSATLPLTGTDATSGVDHVEWTVDGGTPQTGPAPASIGPLTEGTHTIERRVVDVAGNASAYRRSTLRVDLTVPTDTTPAAPAGWQTGGWTVTPTGTDARSGLDAMEVELDGATVTARPVVVTADGAHVLRTRARDAAGNRSAWRAQTVLVDRTAPVDTTPVAGDAWQTTPWTVTPSAADGAGSGVAAVEHRIGDGPAQTGDLTVAAEGVTTVATRATDVAGLASDWRAQTVRVDTAGPVAGVTCAAAPAPTGYLCRAVATDATSGVAALRARVDGGTWQALPGTDATFPVGAGAVEVEAVDVAGNATRAAADRLVARVAPAPTPAPTPTATPAPAAPDRQKSVTVSRRGKGAAGALGSILLTRTDGDVAVDARPLALGAGRQRIVLTLRSGELRARRVRVVKLPRRGGYSPRMGVGLAGAKHRVEARITVARRVGKRWVTVATATARLKP